jgi:hypothetical protein
MPNPNSSELPIAMEKPHVVILGAGCSRQACPGGDANGRALPLMKDFLEIIEPLQHIFQEAGINASDRNFEEIYSELVSAGETTIQGRVETIIYDYFNSLILPPEPNLYDHLLLGLREKDVVATFNWDPFLVQASRRNPILADHGPDVLFLHGNVKAGFCVDHVTRGFIGETCPTCGKSLSLFEFVIKCELPQVEGQIANCWGQQRNFPDGQVLTAE